MEVVSEVISAGRPTVSVEYAEEADLGPINFQMHLILGFKNVENDADPVFVVVPDDALVCVCRVRLYDAAFLLARLRRLVVFQLDLLRVEHHRVVAEEQSLNLDELNVWVFELLA